MDNNNSNRFKNKNRKIQHWQIISMYLVIYDIIAINVAYLFGLYLRFDLRFDSVPDEYMSAFFKFAPIYTVFTIIVFFLLKLYRSLWRFASFSELNRIFIASLITTAFQVIGITLLFKRMPISYYMVGAVTQFILIVAVRFAYRYITLERKKRENAHNSKHNIMLIGAGGAGIALLKDMRSNGDQAGKICCIIDDNPNKWGRLLTGIPIVGGRETILENAEKYKIDTILFAIPSATPEEKRDILNICKETQCELKSLPGLLQLANGDVTLEKVKPVDVEDLLGRPPVKVNMDEIFDQIKDKVILVTGGGGSIGSELCRQIAGHSPKQLIIFDIYENNAYSIEQELKQKYKDELNLLVLIGSVRDSRRINMVFEKYRPDIVYHAAAHKHVPLMESSPSEAIKNNVIGTYKTAYAALKYKADRFILISTDKAVNPTNIMGASKRMCEMVIQSMDAISRSGNMSMLPFLHAHADKVIDGQVAEDPIDHMGLEQARVYEKPTIMCVNNKKRTGTQFAAVRFGNVLGSNGSVIPLFKKQIENGGPVTVTHPDIVRYFMTIPEAVSLVLQAGAYAWGGEIFVLDMGEPVKIDSLARNLIKLSGYTPDVDIKIEYSGLRPGEKLYEERLMAEEGLMTTENEKIHIGKPIEFDIDKFLKQLEKIAEASYENSDNIKELAAEIVDTYTIDKG